MRISIRSRIFLPMISALVIGVGGIGLVGYEAVTGQTEIQRLVKASFEAKHLASEISSELEKASHHVERVTAMTNFMAADEIKAGFEEPNRIVDEKLDGIAALGLGDALAGQVAAMETAHEAWRGDAELVLGLKSADEIPTEEKLHRSFQAAEAEIAKLSSVVDDVAVSTIDSANQSLRSHLTLILEIAGVLALMAFVGIYFIGNGITRPLLQLAARMDALARGNADDAVPHAGRGDEIGHMAAAVEVFRQNAIEQGRLEAEGVALREQAERQRNTDRQQAEEDAQRRLQIATSGLASGLRRLAAGDLAFRLNEQFSAEF